MAPERRVRWAPAALRDVQEIGDYLTNAASVTMAETMLRRIERTIERAAANPLQARSRKDLRPGLRGALVDPYIVFYKVGDDGIELARILHQRRNLAGAFNDPELDH